MAQPMNDDLWGDLEADADDRNPIVELLEAQGRLLAEKTGGRIVGEVRSGSGDRLPVEWRFELVAPMANAFRYPLLRVRQLGLDFPVELVLPTEDRARTWRCDDEDSLRVALAEALRSDATRKALSTVRTLDRLRGRQVHDIEYPDAAGGRHPATLTIEPLVRSHAGAARHVTVETPRGLALEAQFDIDATAEATLGGDAIIDRMIRVVRHLLADSDRRSGDERVRVVLYEKSAVRVDAEGEHPLNISAAG